MVELLEEMKQNENIQVNGRVKIQGCYGTIRYVGSVDGHPGVWVGVEWDDVARGKHDGRVGGARYFQTAHPYSGSMVRIEKVNQFETLEEAIFDRYYKKEENPLDEYLLREAQQFMHAPLLEIVGMDKISKQQSHLGQLAEVSVACCNVNLAGNLGQFKNLTSLDVSSTLIWNWRVVAEIVRQLPSLEFIDLANNRIIIPTEAEIEQHKEVFSQLKGINLRNCGYTWNELLQVAKLWPDIKFLSLQDNNFTHITKVTNQKIFKQLQKLDLQGNALTNFQDILHLGHLKNLKELLLSNNEFQSINFPPCDPTCTTLEFPCLESINLRDNPIKDEVAMFNELDKLQNLQNLSINSSANYEDMVMRAIALISNLKTLNKRTISPADRRNAEIDIWKMFGLQWLQNRDQLRQEVRVYPQLVHTFGQPELDLLKPPPKQSNSISVNLVRGEKVVVKKLPSKMSVQALYGLVSKLFGDDIIQLCAIDSEHSDITYCMENSGKTLDFYSIKSGDTILIE